jgi:hypothetical protein
MSNRFHPSVTLFDWEIRIVMNRRKLQTITTHQIQTVIYKRNEVVKQLLSFGKKLRK